MEPISREELLQKKDYYLGKIRKGSIFIYPTDTIYGIGCNAENYKAVKKLREIKQRYTNPFSIIVPSILWVKEHCIIDDEVEQWLAKLPGNYTLIIKLKDNKCIAQNVNNSLPSIGIRIPLHWFSDMVEDLEFPIVTTSANITGNNFMTSLEDLDPDIRSKVDFIIYEGEKKSRPSILVNLLEGGNLIER